MDGEILDEKEIDTLILRMAGKEHGSTEEEMLKCVRWAEEIRIDISLLESVLDGTIEISFDDKDEPLFKITKKGIEETAQGEYHE